MAEIASKTRLHTCKSLGRARLLLGEGAAVRNLCSACWWAKQHAAGAAVMRLPVSWRGSISLSFCHSLPASLCAPINVLSHTVRRPTGANASACVLLAGVSPSLHSTLAAVLDCSLSNKAWSQSACRQLISGPGGSGLHGGASAAPAAQQMQKREKSFGKTLSLASACMNGTFSVCLECSATTSYSISASKATRSHLTCFF